MPGELIDFKEERKTRVLSPLARALLALLDYCRRLVGESPHDRRLDELRELVNIVDKEMDRG